MSKRAKIAIATGDPAGIGPEISLKAALDPAVRMLPADRGRRSRACSSGTRARAASRADIRAIADASRTRIGQRFAINELDGARTG